CARWNYYGSSPWFAYW
nr:immunoglobulin heavy chain junction region [Mus musculus]